LLQCMSLLVTPTETSGSQDCCAAKYLLKPLSTGRKTLL
jgi:hypothetical protein